MTTPMTTTTIQVPAVGTYTLNPATSAISATTRAMFGLLPVKATFAFDGGELVVADPPSASRATAAVKAGSFDSGTAKRDHHIASSDFLDADNHPLISFAASEVAEVGGRWVVRGHLTVRGTASPLELEVQTVETSGDDVTVRATTTVDRYAFGLLKARGMAAKSVRLDITAHATRS